ncbi:hypothetical protein, partial [Pseudomonas viridiflava]|uniref:hypothetical protein n=1 Tax=Pseudomonas viridiflava TaxID=33069 RepID=UPI003BAB9544
YYVAPLILAAMLMAFHEGQQWRNRDRGKGRGTDPLTIALPLAPLLLGVLVFLSGAMLLVSGALPAAPGRMDTLATILPLPISEMAHVAASLV